MSFALNLSACFIAFMAASGFLFVQLFFATFSLPASIAGAAGLVSAAATFAMAKRSPSAPRWAFWVSALALLGAALHAGHHRLFLAMPGNDCAWQLVGPFAVCLAFVMYVARANGTADQRGA